MIIGNVQKKTIEKGLNYIHISKGTYVKVLVTQPKADRSLLPDLHLPTHNHHPTPLPTSATHLLILTLLEEILGSQE